LGDGAFGTVYKATNTKTGEVVAIKKMKQKYTSWNECIELREIKSLRKLNHSNIIKLKEVLLVAEELYMVFEYLEYNLYEVYSKMKEENKKFTEKEIKYFCLKAGT
jgi:serine/threonine protein kinase